MPGFDEILQKELKNWNVRPRDADNFISTMYHEGSKYAHGNTKLITIDLLNHREAEAAVIVAFLKFQQSWGDQAKVTWKIIPRNDRIREI